MKSIIHLLFFLPVFLFLPRLTASADTETAPDLDSRSTRFSYSVGMQIAESLKASELELDIHALVRGLKDHYLERETLMSDREVIETQRRMIRQQQEARQELKKSSLEASMLFLGQNEQREEITVTESGLQYKIIERGEGYRPDDIARVKIHYTGRVIDGTVFDSSVERGEPAVFQLQGIVEGLSEGIRLMNEGAKYRFYLPPGLGYGEEGAGTVIGPNEVLIFDIELIEIMDNN